jgi:hypothetical protein
MIKLYISVSSNRDWKPQFGASLCMLSDRLASNKLGGNLEAVRYSLHSQTSCLPSARENALIDAEKEGFTHILYLDDDIAFPNFLVERMIAHNFQALTVNYRRKQDKVAGVCLGLDGQIVDSVCKTGIEEVGWMGAGCTMVQIDAIKHIKPPRFSIVWVPEKNAYLNEDYYFSMKLRENGIRLFCDHALSNCIQHIGDASYAFSKEA